MRYLRRFTNALSDKRTNRVYRRVLVALLLLNPLVLILLYLSIVVSLWE